ncbi:MAG TPA: hypothetical protein VFT92_06130 [Nitrospira sp.]|nr:hypothetical protein [Nitrospira sp.]
MAWGDNVNTEDEAERIAAVREYFREHVPNASIRDSYDAGRLAQVFRIEASNFGGFRDAVISTEFLMEHQPDKLGKVLRGWRVAEHLRSVKGTEVLVTTWGIEDKES